jgi:hypothetical protein
LAQPLVPERQLPAPAGGEHAFGVGVAAALFVVFGKDQHVL